MTSAKAKSAKKSGTKFQKFTNFAKNHFHLPSVGGIVVWLILWILDKIVGFSKAVKESH